jgi:hypothetical protein
MVLFLSWLLWSLSFDSGFQIPPKVMAMDRPNPNITHERIVIQLRTLVETRFASPFMLRKKSA